MAVMRQVADVCLAEKVDVVVIAGDVYDVASPSAAAMAQVDAILRLLSSTGARIVMTPGNHDSASRLNYMSSFLERSGIVVTGAYDGSIEPVTIEDEFGPVDIWPVPFVRPADVRQALGMDYAPGFTHNDAVAVLLDRLEIDASRRNVCVSHQFVTSGHLAPEEAGSEMTLGGADAVSASLYDRFDYVALGHIHKPQRVGRETVRYAGSPLKYSKSEAYGTKWFPLVTLGEKGSVDVRRIDFAPLHDVRCVKGPLEALVSSASSNEGDVEDYVFATVTDEHPPVDAQARLRNVYPNLAGYAVENSATAAPAGELDLEAVDTLSPFDLFGEFFSRQAGCEMDDAQKSYVTEKLENLEV
jgi:exonuclease SbcD